VEEVKVWVEDYKDDNRLLELESKYKQEIDKLKANNITIELRLANLMEQNEILGSSLRQFTRAAEVSSLSSQSKEVLININIGNIFRTIYRGTNGI